MRNPKDFPVKTILFSFRIVCASHPRETSYGAAATNGQAKVGIYYNYCAASVGTYCFMENFQYSIENEDICPANWRMPTGGWDYDESTQVGEGEYYELGVALGLTFDEDAWGFNGNTYQTALSTPLSGYYYNNSAEQQGSYGNWWPSHPEEFIGSNIYYVYVSSSYVNPVSYWGIERSYGHSIRCLVNFD